MSAQLATKPDRAKSLDQDIQRLRQQLEVLKTHLMNEPSAETLDQFDTVVEDILANVFGSSSSILDTYEYAEVGEAAGLLNLTDEAPEGANAQTQRETIRQRHRVLESAVADLEARRASLAKESRRPKTTGPRVSDFMAKTVRAISLDATLREAGQALQKWKIGSLVVQSGDDYIGTISETELTSEVVASGADPGTTTVKTCMREPLITIETSDTIVEAVRLMKEKGTRHLVVTESSQVVGVLSVSDIIRYYSGVM